VIPWAEICRAPVPESSQELALFRRGEEYSIRLNSVELMNSRSTGSETALADLACDRLPGRRGPSVLIGGLGMGYTLAAVLRRLDARARVVVAELVPAVVEWVRAPLAELAGRPLDDPRVSVEERDVAQLIGAAPAAWDAILLDVDNGPQALTRPANDGLYSRPGLDAALLALRPGGVLAVWSAEEDRAFDKRLGQAGFAVHRSRVRSREASRGAHHHVWVALRPDAVPSPSRPRRKHSRKDR